VDFLWKTQIVRLCNFVEYPVEAHGKTAQQDAGLRLRLAGDDDLELRRDVLMKLHVDH
jgi:hypothetical protein